MATVDVNGGTNNPWYGRGHVDLPSVGFSMVYVKHKPAQTPLDQ